MPTPYLPNPHEGLLQRQTKAFQAEVSLRLPNATTLLQRDVWSGVALDTQGFTLHAAFVGLQVVSDSLGTAFDDVVLDGVMEGSSGSVWCELVRGRLVYLGPGAYAFPGLQITDSLANMLRFTIQAVDLNEGAVSRVLSGRVDGVLIAGPRI